MSQLLAALIELFFCGDHQAKMLPLIDVPAFMSVQVPKC